MQTTQISRKNIGSLSTINWRWIGDLKGETLKLLLSTDQLRKYCANNIDSVKYCTAKSIGRQWIFSGNSDPKETEPLVSPVMQS